MIKYGLFENFRPEWVVFLLLINSEYLLRPEGRSL